MAEYIQGKYTLGAMTKVGDPRRKHEDRVYKGEVNRTGGEPVILGVVADGVGSADAGERGAQLAIDTVVGTIKNSQGDNIPDMIEHAIMSANKAVYEENQKNDADGLTTLTVAVIYKDRCFIGNVGDSRAYWIQGGKAGKLLQLTRDHSYYNMYGGVDPNSDEGNILVNAIGKKDDVYVDLGFYLKGDDQEQALRLGLNGLPLKEGDAIMLCSDGLIKTNPAGVRYATDNEIVEALRTEYETDMAAIKMVSAALGRRPDDNVSAVTIQNLSQHVIQEIATNKQREQRSRVIKQAVPVIGILSALVVVVALIGAINRYINPPIQILPTYTPYPTLSSPNNIFIGGQGGSIGRLTPFNGQSQELTSGIFSIADNTRIEITQSGASIGLADGSSLYTSAGTIFIFTKTQGGVEVLLETGSIMVRLNGVAPLSVKVADGFTSQVSGSIMGVQKAESGVYVDCYEGHCVISGGSVPPTILGAQISRYVLYSVGVANPFDDVFERCAYWKSAIGDNTVASLGITCESTPPTEPPTFTPAPYTGPTPTKKDRDNPAPIGTP